MIREGISRDRGERHIVVDQQNRRTTWLIRGREGTDQREGSIVVDQVRGDNDLE